MFSSGVLYDGYTAEDIVSAFSLQQLQSYLNVAGSCLFVYYYLTTLANECTMFWKHKFALGPAIFFVVRYFTLAVCVMNLIGLPSGIRNVNGCRVWFYTGWALTIVVNGSVSVFAVMRIFAIAERRWFSVGPPVVLYLTSVAINMVVYLRHIDFSVDVTFSCSDAIRISKQLDLTTVSYINKVCLILADLYVISIICITTYPTATSDGDGWFLAGSLRSFMFRDGLSDFVVLLVLTALDLAYLRSFKLSNPLPTILDIITYILVSKFMLELHHLASHRASTCPQTELNFDTRTTTLRVTEGSECGSVAGETDPVSYSSDLTDEDRVHQEKPLLLILYN
ncbi:hypothetical protein BXZ70DRAFT_235695 [Cristinia sonorae]|uniref:DUF6533 domain-containing protein n=1 Tax=Cristinia sonorae TaxID=1940300 RepID=A0A8K0XP12_9AGAR|nr:hypothetical protein BXZ70DRAFT_235695 [Cristinia sonorae]